MERGRMGVALAQPPSSGDVEAQQGKLGLTTCPCFGHVTWAEIDSGAYTWFTCGICGCPFEV
jgi:hypothetical protein